VLALESDGERITLRPVRSRSSMRKEKGVCVFRSGRIQPARPTEFLTRFAMSARGDLAAAHSFARHVLQESMISAVASSNRIALGPAVVHGKPVFRSTRSRLGFVVGGPADGMSFEEVQREYDVSVDANLPRSTIDCLAKHGRNVAFAPDAGQETAPNSHFDLDVKPDDRMVDFIARLRYGTWRPTPSTIATWMRCLRPL
jgi:uncharacterized protein (DUF433 family)